MERQQARRSQAPQLRRVHIGVDEKTLDVRMIEVIGRKVGDAPMLPELLNQIPSVQDIGSALADGA